MPALTVAGNFVMAGGIITRQRAVPLQCREGRQGSDAAGTGKAGDEQEVGFCASESAASRRWNGAPADGRTPLATR